jgi:hypothetical protein
MQESPIFSRTHDLLLWLLPHAAQFPRKYRFSLGERLARKALDFQESLLAAGSRAGAERSASLRQADLELAQLRHLVRLCHELECFSLAQYEVVSRLLVEIGRLLGGWLKNVSKTGQTV